MAVDSTPGVILTIPRNQIRDRWCRDYALRVPDADVGPGTQPYVDGSTAADAVVPIYSDAVTIGRGTTLRTSAGPWLTIIGEDEGIFRRPAVGASGFLSVTTASGGAAIEQGTIALDPVSGLRYQCAATALYSTDTPVPVQGIDTGPATNLPAGTPLQWQAPPPGLSTECAVLADSDGNGLIGGRDADNDATYRLLISFNRANPAASGNDAQYQSTVRSTPGIQVQQTFTYPAILGAGTIAYCFTLNPSTPGSGRVPNTTEIASTAAYTLGQMPADDGAFPCQIVESPVNTAFLLVWGTGAAPWMDASPWPPYVAGGRVVTEAGATFDSVTLSTTVGGIADPQAGQNIGFFDPLTRTFKLIRVGSVAVLTSGARWTITPDRSYGASDTTFFPTGGEYPSPWSASLNSLVPAVVAYFDGLGPGEQVTTFFDPGTRQRRQPPSPQYYPSLLDARIVIPLYALGNLIETVTPVVPTLPYQTPVGTPGVLSNLSVLGDLAFYQP